MAIHDFFKIKILVNGRSLHEYEVPDTNDVCSSTDLHFPLVHRYIKAKSDVEFTVRINILPGYVWISDNIEVYIVLDGVKCRGHLLHRENHSHLIGTTREIRGEKCAHNGQYFFMPFKFDKLNLDDQEDSTNELEINLSTLGCIEVVLRRTNMNTSTRTNVRKSSKTSHNISVMSKHRGLIPEKALKGRPIELTTSLGNATGVRKFHTVGTYDIDQHPLVKFCFHHRTKKALQGLGIIEKTPEPIPLEGRELSSLSYEEAIELLERQKIATEEAVRMKKENMKATETPTRNLKRSASVDNLSDDELEITSVFKKWKRHEVIDLLDLE